MCEQKIVSFIDNVYTWFNGISDLRNKFAEYELKKIFTPDFVMELNNKEILYLAQIIQISRALFFFVKIRPN